MGMHPGLRPLTQQPLGSRAPWDNGGFLLLLAYMVASRVVNKLTPVTAWLPRS